MKKIFSTIAAIGLFATMQAAEWGYEKHNGPDTWGNIEGFEACEIGMKQSPIDILEKGTQSVKNELKIHYLGELQEILNNGHTLQINTKNENTISYQVRDNKKNNNYGYVDIKSKNTNIKVKRDNSLIKRNYNLLNIFNPFQEKKMKLLFSKKRDASSKNYRTNISTSVSKEKKNNTIFSQDIKHNYSKSSLSQNKTNRIQYTNINSYFNTGGSNKINKKNTNNTSTLSSSNNNNSQSTNNKKIII